MSSEFPPPPPGADGADPSGAAAFGDDAEIIELERPLADRLDPKNNSPSGLHALVLAAVNDRRKFSHTVISQRYSDWNRTDEKQRLFFDLSRGARKGDGSLDSKKKEMPWGRSLVIPASYAIASVRRAQLVSMLLAKDPVHEIQGKKAEDVQPAKAMELYLDYDAQQNGLQLEIYSFAQDADKYGCGVLYDSWERKSGWTYGEAPLLKLQKILPPAILDPLAKRLPMLSRRPRTWGVRTEYNDVSSVDPFNWWPDPRAPFSKIQDSEFQGHRTFHGWSYFEMARWPDSGPFINVDELKGLTSRGGGGARDSGTGGEARTRFAGNQFTLQGKADDRDRNFYATDNMSIRLIPREWKLSPSDRPEIWTFAVCEEQIVVRCHPQPNEHGEFPYSVGESIPDPHSMFNPGEIEMLDGPQRFLDWCYNSRIQNVWKMIHNRYIYDPRYLDSDAVENPEGGDGIPLTYEGQSAIDEGRSPENFYHQIPVQDFTQPQSELGGMLFDLMQRMSGASDPAMGAPTPGDKTLGEVQSILASGSQRTGITAKLLDEMAIKGTVLREIANRQQFTTMEQFFRLTGQDLAGQPGVAGITVRKQDLYGNLDYTPITGTMPADPARMAELWNSILMTVAKAPNLFLTPMGPEGKVLNVREVFNEGIRAAGIKDIDRFWESMVQAPQVVPDGQVAGAIPLGPPAQGTMPPPGPPAVAPPPGPPVQ